MRDLRETSAGTVIGVTVGRKIGFHGATPTSQRAGAAQAAVTSTAGASVATTAPTNSSPYGFSQQQATDLIARVNQLLVDNAALTTLVNELRAANVAKGIIKGSA